MSERPVHATCIALDPGGGPDRAAARPTGEFVAVLLRGHSGSGKSDLALRLIDDGAHLVADDQTELQVAGGRLLARPPAALAGRMEVRGLGIAEVQPLSDIPVGLVVDLTSAEEIERLPEESSCEVLGVRLPVLRLDPFAASAPAKVRLAVRRLAVRPAAREAPAPEPDGAPARATDAERLVVVTGLSGAGRSTALSILEDLGYEPVDNLPLDLLEALIAGRRRPTALGVDIRTWGFAAQPILERLDELLSERALPATLLFLECDDETLLRRYAETRRRHPLAQGRPIADGIAAERSLLAPLRARADHVIDTSALSPADLRRILAGHFALDEAGTMTVCVTSFAFRAGLPREADLVFDVRFLRNPHYQPDLRALTGRDSPVVAYVAADPQYEPFFARLTGFLEPLLPGYRGAGKQYLTIALGCTGGRHRSVVVAERLAQWLAERGDPVTVLHRDLEDGAPAPSIGA